MSPSQEEERLRRLRERQLSDRDPLVKQRKHQQTSAVRTHKAIKSFSFGESLSAIPHIWKGAFIGLILGLAVVFVLPLVIGVFFALLNSRALMGAHRAGWVLNTGMVIAFAFSLVMSFVAVKGLTGFFR